VDFLAPSTLHVIASLIWIVPSGSSWRLSEPSLAALSIAARAHDFALGWTKS
jgi:hypothetical protein